MTDMNVIYENAPSDCSVNTQQCESDTKNGLPNDLKIMSHIKNIEKINEKRRSFLTNTITQYSYDEKLETQSSDQVNNDDMVHIGSKIHTKVNEESDHREKHTSCNQILPTNFTSTTTTELRTPTTPPPKPPMLSRTQSLGVDGLNEPYAGTSHKSSSPITVITATVAIPQQVTHVELRDEKTTQCEIKHLPTPATAKHDTSKEISINHYERLIGELKCPGCAYPMKAPILLCMTGHSICQQCTRVLMLCPLCKEPFTNLRSLTIEALCSKAHFRCSYAKNGCTVRLQIDLLGWHERQCRFKPMKCFMGRVWGDCQWKGREVDWKDHLETEHSSKVFATDSMDLIWNMQIKQKPLTGYYVFIVHDEMFNFYEIYDKERVLFTMTCTSGIRDNKKMYAFEVTITQEDNEALAITHKFPVHSEYDKDILAEGTCVSITLNDLAKFMTDDKLLHYCVRVVRVKNFLKLKALHKVNPNGISIHPIDYNQTQIEGANLKNVPTEVIFTRKDADILCNVTASPESPNEKCVNNVNQSDSENDLEFDDPIAKTWGTPQFNFNRKYLNNVLDDLSSNEDAASKSGKKVNKQDLDDTLSIVSTNTNYKTKLRNTLRKSFRTLKSMEMKPFLRKSTEKSATESFTP